MAILDPCWPHHDVHLNRFGVLRHPTLLALIVAGPDRESRLATLRATLKAYVDCLVMERLPGIAGVPPECSHQCRARFQEAVAGGPKKGPRHRRFLHLAKLICFSDGAADFYQALLLAPNKMTMRISCARSPWQDRCNRTTCASCPCQAYRATCRRPPSGLQKRSFHEHPAKRCLRNCDFGTQTLSEPAQSKSTWNFKTAFLRRRNHRHRASTRPLPLPYTPPRKLREGGVPDYAAHSPHGVFVDRL